MANDEALGPRKTMFVVVIIVGCFAVLWPRILSPSVMGPTQDQLKPNKFDREAGCCEVMFESEVAVLEIINEVCSSAVRADGKLSPYAAAECRKAVNETCGVDIAAFLKRDENVGKTTKRLLDTMKSSNSSCLKEHFGVPLWSISSHSALNSWKIQDTIKQERPPVRAGPPHPALQERGRAIPPGVPPAPARGAVTMPPHVRPPPIPGMRPPLGSPGGPVPAPKSSMGFVMPIYTICIIVFFVYTLSKILFKRTGSSPYETVVPDPQFRRRVFREDSRASPDKLVVTAISGLVAEVRQQMEASYAQDQQSQDLQDNNTRAYTNGTIIHNTGPVHIVASEYKDQSKESSPEPTKNKEPSPEAKELSPEPKELSPEKKEYSPEAEEIVEELKELSEDESAPESKEPTPEIKEPEKTNKVETNHKDANVDLIKLTENLESLKEKTLEKSTDDFLNDARDERMDAEDSDLKRSTPELLEEALKESSPEKDSDGSEIEDEEKGSVKVMGMEVTAHTADGGSCPAPPAPAPARAPAPAPAAAPRAHEAEQVQSIYLHGDISPQARLLVADFQDLAPPHHSPMVVSGKMTLSLIQDAARHTPDRDLESTVDDFTTASALTQPAGEKGEESDEETEEEIEIEEIEEEVEEEEMEEEEQPTKNTAPKDLKQNGHEE